MILLIVSLIAVIFGASYGLHHAERGDRWRTLIGLAVFLLGSLFIYMLIKSVYPS